MDMKTIGMISLIVSGAALIFVEVKKRTTFARLEHNLGERDFDACLALLDQPITKALYSEYNRLYMSLNAYLALGDNENSTRVIERMLPLRMNKKQELAITFAELVYNGQWYTPLREALSAFVDKTQERVTGKVKIKLYKGNMIKAGAWSDYSLYSEEIATFGEDHVYNQADATGFINLFGLPIKVQAQVDAAVASKQKK